MNVQEINILLLGETGVGKSTFINSIANYLNFGDFETALETQDLLILIPTIITITDKNGEPISIKVGSDKNEYQEVGAAGTQDVKTYVFPINEGKTRIRLIDSPGMGDPRGIEQDDINCEHILAYLSHLQELHAICFFMKPTTTRKTILFEYCVKQILSRLEKSASRNIIFIFTNTRGSNYTPGETVPCLKTIVDEIKSKPPYVEIPLCSDNIFSLDNEAFRYLIALRSGYFEAYEEEMEEKCIESWYRSTSECGRFISYIVGDESRPPLTPHQLQSTISVNEARRIITHLSQPLSDISQLIHDNIRVLDRHQNNLKIDHESVDDLKKQLYMPIIRLEVKELSRPVTVCTDPKCAEVVQVGSLSKWHYRQRCHNPCYLTGVPKEFVGDESLRGCYAMGSDGKTCRECNCLYSVHMHIYYETMPVADKLIDENVQKNIQDKEQAIDETQKLINEIDKRKQELEEEHQIIVMSTAQFAHFLQQNAISPYNNSYKNYIKYLINREKSLGPTADIELIRHLQKLESQYEEIKAAYENGLNLTKEYGLNIVGSVALTAQDILNTINKLYKLKHNGQKIQELFKKQKASRHYEYDRSCEYVHRQVSGLNRVPKKDTKKETGKNANSNKNKKKKSNMGNKNASQAKENHLKANNRTNPLPYGETLDQDTDENENGKNNAVQHPPNSPIDPEKFSNALAYMVAVDMIPYDIVEKQGFKLFVKTLNPSCTISSKTTDVEEKIVDLYLQLKKNVVVALRETTSISLTIDQWTNIAKNSFLTITAHFIDSNWRLKSVCLSCRYIAENQTAEVLSEMVKEVLEDYRITKKVVACTTDCKENIVAAVDSFYFPQVCCLGCSISSVFCQIIKVETVEDIVTKAENIYKYFCNSYKASRELNKIQQTLGLTEQSFPTYTSTKCWSVLQLLRFCENQHRAFISYAEEDENFKQHILSQEDLDIINTLLECTGPLINISESLASEKVITASVILPIAREIFEFTGESSEDTEDDKTNTAPVNKATTLKTNFSRILLDTFKNRYSAHNRDHLNFLLKATFLDPRFKDQDDDIYEMLKHEAKQYSPKDLIKTEKKRFGFSSIFTSFRKQPPAVKTENLIIKEFESYVNLKNIDMNEDPLTWWKNSENRFPHLAFLARKYLTGQAASGPSERIFFKGGNIVEDTRTSLTGERIEQIVYVSANKELLNEI